MADYDEDHFNFDMIMNAHHYHKQNTEKDNNQNKNNNEANNKDDKKFLGKKKQKKKKKKVILGNKEVIAKKEKKKATGDNDSKIYECHHPICEKVFYDRNSYRKHLITHGEKQVKVLIMIVCMSI